MRILAHDTAQAVGAGPQKSISQESVGTPPKRQLAPQTSRASTLMPSDEEEEDPEGAADDADAAGKVPLSEKRGALKVLYDR